MSNIVFFGQADAGKSTLAGYIISQYDKDFRLSKFLESMKKANPECDLRLAFSSIINTNKDEVGDSQHLNSRSLHLRKIELPFDNVTIIDTPGSENYRKQRERGMYYGDVGIFFMEIKNILEHKYKVDTIAPIALWSKLNKRMVFILSKFDFVDYSEAAYIKALDELKTTCNFFGFNGEVTVIPTAIEVNKLRELNNEQLDSADLGENICSKSDKMPWFDGLSVVDTISEEIKRIDKEISDEHLMFCITDQVNRPNSKAGKVWNIKILSGLLKTGQEIYLAPVKDENNQLRVLKATVKQLRSDISRFDPKEEISVARKGGIYGIDLKNCYFDKRHTSKGEFDAVSSSCGFDASSNYEMSDKIVIETNADELNHFNTGKEMRFIWFGRSLQFIIKDKFIRENKMYVFGQLKNVQIAMPMNDGDKICEPVLLKGDGLQEFYSCKLIKIGDIEKLTISS